jgi:WD40 repeat protein/energy-coupling factor transporter ATP-binding protein EcfA2
MDAEPGPEESAEEQPASGEYRVDARGALGVQVGDGSTQIIYSYNKLTWTDGVAPPPLVDVLGDVDSPYRGLRAFEERDAAFFFGRETAATQVLERVSQCLDKPELLVVSGASGAGKSSLLMAGVLPRMRGVGLASAPEAASWPCLVFTPTRAPLDELGLRVAGLAGVAASSLRQALVSDPAGFALTVRQAALAGPAALTSDPEDEPERSHRRLVIVVDQFEQLFTQCSDEEQRRRFITALSVASTARSGRDQTSAAVVVLGVRADFEARCADYQQLADAVQNRYLVRPMTGRQLRMAITEPAQKAGFSVEDGLVDVLLQEVRSRQPVFGEGVLPLLSHALDQAWRSRTGPNLTLADYERTGGIEGAVADSAQRAYDQLTSAQQTAARQIFTRLTTTTSDGTDTIDRVGRAELTAGKNVTAAHDVEAVLEAFAAERLLTLAADTVEISHEVLLTAWPLLRDTWLAETHADRIVRTRLRSVAAEWARQSRDPSYLYSGSLLETATEAAAHVNTDSARQSPLSEAERDFLQASDRAHRRKTHRREGLIAFLTAMLIAITAVAVLAIHARQDAVKQRNAAASGQLAARSEALGDTDPAISKLLSVAAWRIHRSDAARYAMLSASALPGLGVLTANAGFVYSVAFSSDGKTLASGRSDGTIQLWNVATSRPVGKPLNAHAGEANSVAFSHDGKILACGYGNGTIWLWDVATGQSIGKSINDRSGEVNSVAFSPDGKVLASGDDDGTVQLWKVATERPIGNSLRSPAGTVNSVAFSADGKILASGNQDGTIRLWDVGAGRPIGNPLAGHSGQINSVAFDPVGNIVASGDQDGTVQLWNAATGQPVGKPLAADAKMVNSLAFSPDGKTLASGSDDETVRLWDVATRQQIGPSFTGHTGFVLSVAFSPDGKTLASSSVDGTIRLWNVAIGQPTGSLLTGDTQAVNSVAFSLDGKILATGNGDGMIWLWRTATARLVKKPLAGYDGEVKSVAFSPDSKTLASGNANGAIRLWDVATGRPLDQPFSGDAHPVNSVAFSPAGKILATGDEDGAIRLWDVATGRALRKPLTGDGPAVNAVAFSPDGKILASGGADTTVQLWDVATGKMIHAPLTGHTYAVQSLAFSPNGAILASSSIDYTIRLWDVATGQPVGIPLNSDAEAINSVGFSPNGAILASGGADGTVRLWNVATGQQIGSSFTGQAGEVNSVAFSPSGNILASGNADGTAQLWNISYVNNAVSYLCASVGRSLTRAEWAQYVPSGPSYQDVCPKSP